MTCYGLAVWRAESARRLSAIELLQQTLRHAPYARTPRFELLRLYEQLDRLPAAIRTAQQIVDEHPNDLPAAAALARLLAAIDATDEIGPLARRLLPATVPSSQAAELVELAQIWHRSAPSAAEGVTACRWAIGWLQQHRPGIVGGGFLTPHELERYLGELHESLGLSLWRQEQLAAAATAFTQAARHYQAARQHAAVDRQQWHLARVMAARGEPAAAAQLLRPYLTTFPPSPLPYLEFYRWQKLSGRGEQAWEELQRLRAMPGAPPELQTALAIAATEPAGTVAATAPSVEELVSSGVSAECLQLLVQHQVMTGELRRVLSWLERAVAAAQRRSGTERAIAAERLRLLAEAIQAEPAVAAKVVSAVRSDPSAVSAGTCYCLGRIAERVGEYVAAGSLYRQAWEQGQGAVAEAALLALADLLHSGGQWEELERLCRQALAAPNAPRQHWLYLRQAQALAAMRHYPAALAAAEQALTLWPSSERSRGLQHHAQLLITCARPEAALALARQQHAQTTEPHGQARWLGIVASALERMGRQIEGLTSWQEAVRLDPDYALANRECARLLAALRPNDAAALAEAERLARHACRVERWWRRHAEQYPRLDAPAHAVLGRVLHLRGELVAARRELERAAALPEGQRDPQLWQWLAETYEQLGETSHAAAAREHSRRLSR